MPDSLEGYKSISADFSEVYEVVRTVTIVKRGKRYRLEVEKCYSNSLMPYTVSCWVEEDVTLQPSFPRGRGGKFEREPEVMHVWKRYLDLPWVAENDPDAALRYALVFLADQKH